MQVLVQSVPLFTSTFTLVNRVKIQKERMSKWHPLFLCIYKKLFLVVVEPVDIDVATSLLGCVVEDSEL